MLPSLHRRVHIVHCGFLRRRPQQDYQRDGGHSDPHHQPEVLQIGQRGGLARHLAVDGRQPLGRGQIVGARLDRLPQCQIEGVDVVGERGMVSLRALRQVGCLLYTSRCV